MSLKATTALALCVIGAPALAGDPPLQTVQVADGFVRPVYVTHAPSDFERIFIVQQPGTISMMRLDTGAVSTFLNIENIVDDAGNEQGLLGLAFHPDHFDNGLFYVHYNALAPNNDTIIAQYKVRENPDGTFDFDKADSTSELRMMTVDQPFTNHNGGWIDFAPPGFDEGSYLYIALGDGGSANDPGERAQDITNQLLGKMLRIDVDGDDFPGDDDKNYAIPPSNPFTATAGDDEIWAYGLRNPWRCCFDSLTGDLIIGDVGQNAVEEIDFQPAHIAGALPGMPGYNGGFNYGWDCLEGNNCQNVDVGCSCSSPGFADPIHTYSHAGGNCSVTGGEIYRGCAIPGLEGTYFFADVCSNQIWSFETDGTSISNFNVRTGELNPPGPDSISSVASFGRDAFGEIYICDLFGGEVFKIIPEGGIANDCNENNLDDACEIAAGIASDNNGNGIPDDCEDLCPEDIDGSGTVDSVDLNNLLALFGQPTNGPADIDGSGTVDSTDLNLLLALFGQDCP